MQGKNFVIFLETVGNGILYLMEYNLKSHKHAGNCWHVPCLKHVNRAEGSGSDSTCCKPVIVSQRSITESPTGHASWTYSRCRHAGPYTRKAQGFGLMLC